MRFKLKSVSHPSMLTTSWAPWGRPQQPLFRSMSFRLRNLCKWHIGIFYALMRLTWQKKTILQLGPLCRPTETSSGYTHSNIDKGYECWEEVPADKTGGPRSGRGLGHGEGSWEASSSASRSYGRPAGLTHTAAGAAGTAAQVLLKQQLSYCF